jgi:hypothetical protein
MMTILSLIYTEADIIDPQVNVLYRPTELIRRSAGVPAERDSVHHRHADVSLDSDTVRPVVGNHIISSWTCVMGVYANGKS